MMEKYLNEHVSNLKSKKAFGGYVKGLNVFFRDYMVAEITVRMINEYKNKRRSDGVKPATINRELATIKKAFNLALKQWEWVTQNPVMTVAMERENNKRDRWLSDEEQEKLLKVITPEFKELVIFALNTGMRLSEVLTLSWKGVDLFRKTITVFKSKKNEKRTIPINGTIFEMLKSRARVRSIKTDLVFPSRVRTVIDKCNAGKIFRSAVEEAGIEDFKFHDLRHTFATRLVQAGCDIYKVQNLLGHKSPTMTQRYAHHCPESLRDAVLKLDKKECEENSHITILSQSTRIEVNLNG
jgi:site-specific recombinase XerD